MEVEDIRLGGPARIDDLDCGDAFVWGDETYMAVDDALTAVSLNTGYLRGFPKDSTVYPVTAKVTIS